MAFALALAYDVATGENNTGVPGLAADAGDLVRTAGQSLQSVQGRVVGDCGDKQRAVEAVFSRYFTSDDVQWSLVMHRSMVHRPYGFDINALSWHYVGGKNCEMSTAAGNRWRALVDERLKERVLDIHGLKEDDLNRVSIDTPINIFNPLSGFPRLRDAIRRTESEPEPVKAAIESYTDEMKDWRERQPSVDVEEIERQAKESGNIFSQIERIERDAAGKVDDVAGAMSANFGAPRPWGMVLLVAAAAGIALTEVFRG